MKKLLIASAIAASFAGVAMADQAPVAQQAATGFGFSHPFVAATIGTNTNDEYSTKAYAKADTLGNSSYKAHAILGGLQAGADLYTVNPQLALGAEVDANYSFKKPEINESIIPGGKESIKYTRFAINPMAFVSYSPISELTLKAKAGYGYQHAKVEDSVNSSITSTTISKWRPVVAGEAQYNVTKNIGILVGDRYTFGKNIYKEADQELSVAKNMPHENVVYAGLKYTF